jgi:pimeloyl-ACP methyl ester carboxylesterase
MTETEHLRLEVSPGRSLAVSQYGEITGKPVFFFHGWPGARLQGRIAHEPSRSLGIRLIAVDRPGFGGSDFQPERRILDWPADITRVADLLGLSTFSVLGLSGGAPYALVCGSLIPERIQAIGIICGIGPSHLPGATEWISKEHRNMMRIARYAPWSLGFFLGRRRKRQLHEPEAAYQDLLESLPEIDRQALAKVKDLAMAATAASLKPGIRGHAWELRLFSQPWGFEREAIELPVALWHGEDDKTIFPKTGRMQADALPNCSATFIPGEGHYSLNINRIEEMLRDLTQL